jgi:hypothetical protein
MPKGVTGGLQVTRMPGIFSQIWLWLQNRSRSKG